MSSHGTRSNNKSNNYFFISRVIIKEGDHLFESKIHSFVGRTRNKITISFVNCRFRGTSVRGNRYSALKVLAHTSRSEFFEFVKCNGILGVGERREFTGERRGRKNSKKKKKKRKKYYGERVKFSNGSPEFQ